VLEKHGEGAAPKAEEVDVEEVGRHRSNQTSCYVRVELRLEPQP
jgi:hypothetical protein